jgi:hypothetical protein
MEESDRGLNWGAVRQGRTLGGAARPPKIDILKNMDFVDTMISNVLRDLSLAVIRLSNRLVTSTYIRSLKNKINIGISDEIKNAKKIRHCDLN